MKKKYLSPVGKYTFSIQQRGKWFIAIGKTTANPKGTMITQGNSVEDIFKMIADAYKCILWKHNN